MSTGKRKAAPAHTQQVRPAAASAIDDILDQQTLDALMNVDPATLTGIDDQAEIIKGRAKPAGCWLHGPAQLELNAVANRRLTKVAEQDHLPKAQVSKVSLKLIPGTKLLIIKPAASGDLTATPVGRYGNASTAWINAYDLLGPAELTVRTHWKSRFDVAFAPMGSPLWPALVINLGKSRERRRIGKKKGAGKPFHTDSGSHLGKGSAKHIRGDNSKSYGT